MTAEEQVKALIAERTNLIETKRQQIEALERQLADARRKNRELHRRAQAHESEQAMLLRETGYHEMKRSSDMWARQWKAEFDRLMRSHQQMKAVYEICAPVLGLPYGKYHSVMDHKFGERFGQRIFANVLVPGGVESHDVVEVVQRLAERIK